MTINKIHGLFSLTEDKKNNPQKNMDNTLLQVHFTRKIKH